jgi:HD superfamily phosphodiesterase
MVGIVAATSGLLSGTVYSMSLTSWAALIAERHLSPLGNRWLHVRQVAEQARCVAAAIPPGDRDLLIAAAYLHDVGWPLERAQISQV